MLRRHRWAGVLHDCNLMTMLYDPTLVQWSCQASYEKGCLDDFEYWAHGFARATTCGGVWPGYNWVTMASWCRDTQSPLALRRLADLLNAMGVEVPETVPRP